MIVLHEGRNARFGETFGVVALDEKAARSSRSMFSWMILSPEILPFRTSIFYFDTFFVSPLSSAAEPRQA